MVPRSVGLCASSAVLVVVLACARHPAELPPCDVSAELPHPPRDLTAAHVIAAGDIGECSSDASERTSELVDLAAPDAVLVLGDVAYPDGTLEDFLGCYAPRWGRHRSITRAAVGNHEYHSPHAAPYFAYFCGSSGAPFHGYYSFELGAWHVVVLNSNCGHDPDVGAPVEEDFGGCRRDSPQAAWLRTDLAEHPGKCTLAMWHHPLFSSGPHASDAMSEMYAILVDAGVDLVLNGHAHLYERFAPMLADGTRDDARGITEIVVGTGGHDLLPLPPARRSGSMAMQANVHGVLDLVLQADRAHFSFVPVRAGAFADEGDVPCH